MHQSIPHTEADMIGNESVWQYTNFSGFNYQYVVSDPAAVKRRFEDRYRDTDEFTCSWHPWKDFLSHKLLHLETIFLQVVNMGKELV